MKKNLTQKIIFTLVIALIAIPFRSYAFLGVGDETQDPGDIAVNSSNLAIQGFQEEATVENTLKTFGLDGLAYSIAQQLSQKLVSEVLNAVNGGASQNKPPNFITNFTQYFTDISNKQTSNFINQIFGSSSNPFAKQIGLNITNATAGLIPKGLDTFTLGKVLTNGASWQSASTNISVAGSQGWDFYNQAAFPANTPLGSSLVAQQALGQAVSAAQNLATTQLASSGFKPNVTKAIGADVKAINFNALGAAANKAVKDNKAGNAIDAANASGPTDQEIAYANLSNGDLTPPSSSNDTVDLSSLPPADDTDTLSINGQTVTLGGTSDSGTATEDYSDDDADTDSEITTPQANTSATTNDATGEAGKRLQGADTFFKIIFGALTQMATGLINKGLSSLGSNGGSSQVQYGSPADAAKALASSGSWLATPQNIVDFRSNLDVANQLTSLDVLYTQEMLDLTKQPVTGLTFNTAELNANIAFYNAHSSVPFDSTSEALDQFNAFNKANPNNQLPFKGSSDALIKLEQCIPGPDTGWDTRLQQYTDAQLKATQTRSSKQDDDGTNNAKAYKLVNQIVQTATQEEHERIDDPFLNIPGASELQLIAASYYANTQKFQTLFNNLMLKRQTASQLVNIVAQVKAFTPSLVLFNDQWIKLTGAQQSALYATLSPDILRDLPSNDYVTVDAAGNPALKPLPVDDPTTPNDENNDEMRRRVLDEEWFKWENDTTDITNRQRQSLYAQFVAVQQGVTTANVLQDTKNKLQSLEQQNIQLADAYQDCKTITDAVKTHWNDYSDADWTNFKNTQLIVPAIKAAFTPDASIIAVAKGTSGIDFSREGDITLPLDESSGDLPTGDFNDLAAYLVTKMLQMPLADNQMPPNTSLIANATNGALSALMGQLDRNNDATHTMYLDWVDQNNINALQVQPVVPLTTDTLRNAQIGTSNVIGGLFKEDSDATLFCRLPGYTLNYWIPKGLTGQPIGCYSVLVGGYSSSHGFSTAVAGTNPGWYHTNRAEIYYDFTNPTR